MNGGKKGKAHVFRVTGSTVAAIAQALEVLRAAIMLHTGLMYALAAGRRVPKEHSIYNISFTFLAPGRHAAMRYVHSLSSGNASHQLECEPPSSLRVREIERILEDDEWTEANQLSWQPAHYAHSRSSSGTVWDIPEGQFSAHNSERSSTPPSSPPSSPRSGMSDSSNASSLPSFNSTAPPYVWSTAGSAINDVQEPCVKPPILGFGLRSNSIWSVPSSWDECGSHNSVEHMASE